MINILRNSISVLEINMARRLIYPEKAYHRRAMLFALFITNPNTLESLIATTPMTRRLIAIPHQTTALQVLGNIISIFLRSRLYSVYFM